MGRWRASPRSSAGHRRSRLRSRSRCGRANGLRLREAARRQLVRFEDIKRDQKGWSLFNCQFNWQLAKVRTKGSSQWAGSKDTTKPTCNRTKPVRVNWSRNTARKVESRETTRQWAKYALYGQVCWLRCAVAVLDLRALCGAPLRTDLRESAKNLGAGRGTTLRPLIARDRRECRAPVYERGRQ